MAELALTLPVVIASPGDVATERDVVESVIESYQKRAAKHRLLLEAVRWEKDMRPTLDRPQNAFNDDHLRRAELVVFVLWSSLGSPSSVYGDLTGTLEELELAQALIRSGSTDDLFIYFRRGNAETEGQKKVVALKDEINASKRITSWDYFDAEDLRRTFSRHLESWLDRWVGVPEICENTMWRVPPQLQDDTPLRENRLHAILLHFDLAQSRAFADKIGEGAIRLYQSYSAEGYGQPLEMNADALLVDAFTSQDEMPPASRPSLLRPGTSPDVTTPLRRLRDGSLRFGGVEWFFFFCAVGLLQAVLKGQTEAVERYPYRNQVHQYLAALLEREQEKRAAFVAVLVEWLGGKTGSRGKPVVRNFAAYVLGMITAVEAEDQLASAARDDSGQDVRTYSICALGKMRSRRHLGLLAKLWSRARDDRERLLLGQAICRVTGVAHYEL